MTVDETSHELQSTATSRACKKAVSGISVRGTYYTISKYFDSDSESLSLSESTSSVLSISKPRWICVKCRQVTTDEKHKFGNIGQLTFYCCDACWHQFRLQIFWGTLFRMFQIHFCFITLWIPSPKGVFTATKDTNHGEWAGVVVLLVMTLVFMIASFVNVIWVRPMALLKRVQKRRPVLDLNLESICALCWMAIIAVMTHDGVRVYGTGRWNGALIALIVCAWVMLASYLLSSVVAWKNLIRTTTTITNGSPDPFGERRKVDIWQAITYLS